VGGHVARLMLYLNYPIAVTHHRQLGVERTRSVMLQARQTPGGQKRRLQEPNWMEQSSHPDFTVGSDMELIGITWICSRSDTYNAECTSIRNRNFSISIPFQLRDLS
jgi:hypothetical protein